MLCVGGADGGVGGERERGRIVSYQEAFVRMKEATGVSEVEEVVDRFRTQDDTFHNLQQQKSTNAQLIDTLSQEVLTHVITL